MRIQNESKILIEKELEDLCKKVICLLKEYLGRGFINEEEFKQHVRLKEDFLKRLKDG